MYNADKLRSSGERYDPHYVAAQDYDFHSRLLPYGDMENIPEALYHYRISGAQTSFVTGKSGRLEENPMVRGYAMEIQRRNLRRAAGGTEIEDDILEVLGRWRQPSSPMELVEMVPRVHHLISQIDAVGVNGGEVIESRFRAVCSQYLTSYESPGPRHLKLMLRLREHLDLRARDWAKQCVRNLLGLTAQRRRTIRGRLLHRTRRIPDVGNA